VIVVVAPFPGLGGARDGSYQRFAWIDRLMDGQPRTYLDLSLRHHRTPREQQVGEVRVLQLNALVHRSRIREELAKATVVYVHSVFNAIKVWPTYLSPKVIVTDMHGIVPEELRHHGHPWQAWLYGLCERLAVRRSQRLVCVTQTMRKHFENKYRKALPGACIIPILPELQDDGPEQDREPGRVVYAGGVQRWQNVDLMLAAAADRPEFSYDFLSDQPQVFEDGARRAGLRHYQCGTVPARDVPAHYRLAEYGFLLRDDIPLNRVACPTKLVEYMHWGVVPIVLSEQVGDFGNMGMQCVLLADFRAGRLPDAATLHDMRSKNRAILRRMRQQAQYELNALTALLQATA
jgi:hypothetical protein